MHARSYATNSLAETEPNQHKHKSQDMVKTSTEQTFLSNGIGRDYLSAKEESHLAPIIIQIFTVYYTLTFLVMYLSI